MTNSHVASHKSEATGASLARVLCLGDLGPTEERKCDLRFFFHYPEAEFVHVGMGPPQQAQERTISLGLARKNFLAGKYAMVVAGHIPVPMVNPRKNIWRGMAHFLSQSRSPARAVCAWQAQRMLPLFGSKLAILDLEDRPIIDNRRFFAASCCRWYFKRELPQNPANAFLYTSDKNEDNGNIPRQPFFAEIIPKLRPISIGVEPALLAERPAGDKTADLFFAGRTANRPNRILGLRNLLRLRDDGYRMDLPETKLSKPEFLAHCAAALTVWSPEGFGYDCRRTYEAAAMGAVPVLQYPTIQRHAPLLDGVHAIYYGVEGEHLYHVLKAYLDQPERLEQMGQAVRAHVAQHHGFGALARHIVRVGTETTSQ